MSRLTFTQRFVVLFLANFLFCLSISAPSFAQTSSADEGSLRRLVERYFAAYEKKDSAELISLWSEKSPDLAANNKVLRSNLHSNSKA